MKTLIIVPAYNEAKVILETLEAIKAEVKPLKADIVVVNDGSSDETKAQALKADVKVLTHRLNRGLGGAIGTGLEYARRNGYDYAVTIDADGQHDPKDIIRSLKPLQTDEADVVIGSRFIHHEKHMPADRKILLSISNWLTYILFGQATTDSLSGFRAFNKRAIEGIHIKTERMEVSNEFFGEIKRLGLRVTEVPIKILYTQYSRAKGQQNSNAINIVYKLVIRLFR